MATNNENNIKVTTSQEKTIFEEKHLVTISLNKPVLYMGETIESLDFDFEKLTGADALAIGRELKAIGTAVIIPRLESEYLIRAAARACTRTVNYDIFEKMSIADFNRVCSTARDFL